MALKSELLNYLEGDYGTNVAVLSTTDSLFWCSESGNSMNCTRPWVQEWELFSLKTDQYSGKTLIQSNQTRKYARVSPNDNHLYCDVNSAIMEARFDIADGAFKCYNSKFITNTSNGPLTATSDLPVNYELFDVISVTVLGSNGSYIRPTNRNGKPVISVDSTSPVRFYVLTSKITGVSYLETENFQFTYPTSEIEPITYAQTQIDQKNFRYTINKPTAQKNYWTIQADFNGKFLGWDQSGTYATCLFPKYADDAGLTTQFQIYPVK